MASLNVSMPKEMRKFVDARTKETSHSTPTEYIRTLIREDQRQAERDELEKLLLAGLDGKVVDASTQEWWDNKRKELRRRFGRRKSA